MRLLGIIRSGSMLLLVLFLTNLTARSNAQAALDFMDMESSTLGPPQENPTTTKDFTDIESSIRDFPQENPTRCKGDIDCEEQTQQDTTDIPGTDDTIGEEQTRQFNTDSEFTENFCGPPPQLEYGRLKEEYLDMTIFPKGAEIKYICRPGYVRIPLRNSVARCLADTTWSRPEIFCARKSCGNPGDVENGQMEAENFDFGSRVTYVCNPGYAMISKRNYRDCQADGKWSNDLPECTVLSCPSPPAIANGHYYPDREDYTYLDSVKYICSGNRALIGEQTIACTVDGTWSSNAPECKVVECSNPNVNNGYQLSGYSRPYSMNSVVRFKCRQQYKLFGSDTVKCNQNSQWEPELPRCLRTCYSVPRFQYAELLEPTTDSSFVEGTELKFKCKEGYESFPDAVTTVKCLGTHWSSSRDFCKSITCVEPATVPKGKIISGMFSYGNRITYACETGYKIKNNNYRICLSDRSWSLPIPECEVQPCAIPGNLKNGYYSPQLEEYVYNDTVKYHCHEGFQLVGQESITCRNDGRWNYNTPECRGLCNPPPDLDYAQLQNSYATMFTFFAGTTVQYICRPGYYQDQRFTNAITCLGNFTWSKISDKFCKIYKCSAPVYLNNGWYDPELEEYLHNDTVTYDCNEGFQLLGQASITCRNGRWNYNTPACRGICDNPPDLNFAQPDFSVKDIKTFFVGNTVQYNCKPGYVQSNIYRNNIITCLGNFTWSKLPKEICNRISCGRLPKVANTVLEAEDFLFETEAIYKCEKGYKITSGSNSLKCGSNGRWNGTLPVCEVQKCLPPEDLKYGSYSLKKEEYTYNESVIYKCNTLQLVGKASVSCSDDGKWSSGVPQCKAVCIFPPELDFAVVEEEYIHQEVFDSGKTVQYKCRPGFVPVTGKNNTLTCLTDLKWSQHELICTPISCGDPGSIEHGQMQSENFFFGSRVNYTCTPGYSMISKRNYRECQADGTWSGYPPVCKEPICDHIWELQEEARRCTSTPDEWIKYLQVQYLYLQIENLKLDIEMKKRQLDTGV